MARGITGVIWTVFGGDAQPFTLIINSLIVIQLTICIEDVIGPVANPFRFGFLVVLHHA